MKYVVHWDNGNACGTLGSFESPEEAAAYGQEWFNEMVSSDQDPQEARKVYEWEVIEEEETGW